MHLFKIPEPDRRILATSLKKCGNCSLLLSSNILQNKKGTLSFSDLAACFVYLPGFCGGVRSFL
jgi:hypothetical protein